MTWDPLVRVFSAAVSSFYLMLCGSFVNLPLVEVSPGLRVSPRLELSPGLEESPGLGGFSWVKGISFFIALCWLDFNVNLMDLGRVNINCPDHKLLCPYLRGIILTDS